MGASSSEGSSTSSSLVLSSSSKDSRLSQRSAPCYPASGLACDLFSWVWYLDTLAPPPERDRMRRYRCRGRPGPAHGVRAVPVRRHVATAESLPHALRSSRTPAIIRKLPLRAVSERGVAPSDQFRPLFGIHQRFASRLANAIERPEAHWAPFQESPKLAARSSSCRRKGFRICPILRSRTALRIHRFAPRGFPSSLPLTAQILPRLWNMGKRAVHRRIS